MMYTNDEADKAERYKRFYLSVYLFPFLTTASLAAVLYWAYLSGYVVKNELIYGCILALTPAYLLFKLNRPKWLKMPDGTYHNIEGESVSPRLNINEPSKYEAEFFYSKKSKATSLLMGLALIGVSVWLYTSGAESILIPLGTASIGFFLTRIGLKGLLDKSAQLKIATNGLWTKKLGFVNWDDLNYAEVVVTDSERQPQTYLEIRLKGTKYEQANQPDQRLILTDLQYKEDIEMVINQTIINYNNRRKSTEAVSPT